MNRFLKKLLIASIVIGSIGASFAHAQSSGTINTLDQFTSTTTGGYSSATQRTYGKPVMLTGLTIGECVTIGTNHIATTTGAACGSGGGGGSGFSTTSNDYWKTQRNFFSTTSTDYWLTIQGLLSSSQFNGLFDNRLSATTSLPNIATLNGLTLPFAQTSGTVSIARGGTGLASVGASSTVLITNGTAAFWQRLSTSQITNDSGYLSSLVGAASSTLLADNNTFTGTDRFNATLSANALTLTNALTAENGGTGLNAVGASSTILMSDGTVLKYNKLTVGNFVSANISQFTNDSSYLTSETDPIVKAISGIVKSNGTVISAAANGTDYTLISANACSAGNHVSAVTASGVITCSADTGSGGASGPYDFPLAGNATSTLTQFNGGLTAYASTTIGDGTGPRGLTINGNSTTTAMVNASNINWVRFVPTDFRTNGCAASSTPYALTYQGCLRAFEDQALASGAHGLTIWTTFDVSQTAWTDTLHLDLNGLQVSMNCTAGTRLIYGGTGTSEAVRWNFGDPTGHLSSDSSGCTYMGNTSLIVAGQANTKMTTGMYFGGNQGAVGINFHDNSVNGFGKNIVIGQNAYMLDICYNAINGGNGTTTAGWGSNIHINAANNSGERNNICHNKITDPGNLVATSSIYISDLGTASNFITDNSIDNVGMYIGSSNGLTVVERNHWENAGCNYPGYALIMGKSSDKSTHISFNGNEVANDCVTSKNFYTLIFHGGIFAAWGNHIDNYGSGVIAAFVDHSLDNGISSDLVCSISVQGGGLTNIVAGSGGVAYSLATGAGCVVNVSNSYTIGMRPQGSNTNEFFSGSNVVGTFDHSGNWTQLGNDSVGGTLGVTGAATFSSTLSVTGKTTLTAASSTVQTISGSLYLPNAAIGQGTALCAGTIGIVVSCGIPANEADVNVTNTAASSTAFTLTTYPQRSFAANTLTAGKQLCVDLRGLYSAPLAGSVIVRLVMGTGTATTTIAQVTTSSLLNAANQTFTGNGCLTIRTLGASGIIEGDGLVNYMTGLGQTATNFLIGSTTIDTTVRQTIDVTLQWDSATASRLITITQGSVKP